METVYLAGTGTGGSGAGGSGGGGSAVKINSVLLFNVSVLFVECVTLL